ncbi:unnamed protein product [Mytilus coruscus]|uniref:Apple domain-containing protein n=1 Tax=Mytilus coruscus TaxID=42192 RepID=A0A6J8CCJ8_MYTCO|nr:unnamed protein product [Mytilus coruscus]
MRHSIYQGLLLLYKVLQTSAEQCTSETFRINPDKRDVKLSGFTFRTFENISPRACFQKCIRRTRCLSYNYNRASLRCELNLKPMCVSEGDFQNEIGYVYVEVHHYLGDPLFDPCVGNPCKEGEVCESLQNKKVVCLLDDCKIPKEKSQNVALGKISRQSSTRNKNMAAKYAVDGLTNTFQSTRWRKFPYWWVDLGNIYNIMRIEVINRSVGGYRLRDLDIAVGPCLDDLSIFAHYIGPAKKGEHLVFQRSRYRDGRFVKLTINKVHASLQVAEVQVFAYPVC